MTGSHPGDGPAARKPGMLVRLGLHRPELRAWALYDWANSAFVLIVITAVFPIFYKNVPAAGLPEAKAMGYYSWVTTIVLLLIAVFSPMLGALADFRAWRKRFLTATMIIGVIPTACMVFLHEGDWPLALLLFGLGNLGLSSSFTFYDSLLPHVARPDEVDRVSTGGYALGYLGSGLLLILNLLWIQMPESWGFANAESATRFSFLSVAIWWLLFSLPILRIVREPPRQIEKGEKNVRDAVSAAFARLRDTIGEMRGRYRQAFLLLLAILIYTEGIGTIIRMAAIYASSRGLPDADVIFAILLVQFLGIPFSFLFGGLSGVIGPKRSIMVGLIVYGAATLVAYSMETVTEFYILALLIGMVQGGTQALSRSLFASMVPHHRTSEFFGIYAVAEKVGGFIGPMVFSTILAMTGSTQPAVLSIVLFFIAGGLLLGRVNVERGRREAEVVEERTVSAGPSPA